MRKLLIFVIFLLYIFWGSSSLSLAAEAPDTGQPTFDIPCGCTSKLSEIYAQRNERCVDSYDTFKQDPFNNHYWIQDPQVTAQAKADERARQFIYWVINSDSIDNHQVILGVWNVTRNMAGVFVIIIAAIMGIGIVIGQRANFGAKVQVSSYIWKLLAALVYIALSAAIVLSIIQLSELLMKFFIENLGGSGLFNIDFGAGSASADANYLSDTPVCRDLNLKVTEGISAEIMMLKMTNIVYYIMGSMLLLRKILLWFLLFVSPFLAVLMPFVFIRNIGWIWIGVFFQWVFYGPLFALFLGALARIWSAGIPFTFDFSRTPDINLADPANPLIGACKGIGYIYPSGINILYGGPAQKLSICNNGNYIDTFVEYIITLLMLMAVTFFPWWLLRIFRDYCCDGILAMKNILLSMYDQMRGGPPPSTSPGPTFSPSSIATALKIPRQTDIPVKVKLETIEEIKKTKTEEISRSLNLQVSKLTDIARMETNKKFQETTIKNINLLKNPIQAETPTERQKYLNIRTELFNRAVKEDRVAKQILSSISTSQTEQVQKREELLRTIPQRVPVTHIVSVKVKMPQTKLSSITSSIVSQITSNSSILNNISSSTQTAVPQVQSIFSSLTQNVQKPTVSIVSEIVKETGVTKEKVTDILRYISNAVSSEKTIVSSVAEKTNTREADVQTIITFYKENKTLTIEQMTQSLSSKTGIEKEKVATILKETEAVYKTKENINDVIKEVAKIENVREEEVQKIIQTQIPLIAEPEKHIEQAVAIPPSVSLEDYEQVKHMWQDQYEKGEVPVTENIKSRSQWLDNDIVFITNTLNKILSPDEKIKQEGLNDIGYIIPIFLINNMKGEELAVYLKAKLEAAKTVKEQKEKEDEATRKVKKEEEFVEVEKPKATEAEKTMEMKRELSPEEPKKEEKPGGPPTESPKAPAAAEESKTKPEVPLEKK